MDWRALYGLSYTHPELVRDMLDKMVADYEKPCPHILDMFTRENPEGDGFIVDIVYPAKPQRPRRTKR